MKKLILVLLLTFVSHVQAGWFSPSKDQQRLQQTEQQLNQQRASTGAWQLLAGVFALGAVTLLFVGTALGSRTRRHEKED